ncbi:MAG: sugar phosphate nucleotidyltransferase [Rectinemataceae bacterium]
MPFSSVVKALIPIAKKEHSSLPLQSVFGVDGTPVPLVQHLVAELLEAGIEEVCLVVNAGSHALVFPVLEPFSRRVRYVWQDEPKGFGHALWCAREWVGSDPVLVQVCDHLFLQSEEVSCVRQMIEAWGARGSSICGIQRIREVEVPHVGVVSGKRVDKESQLYLLDSFLEKPSLTKAELLPHIQGLGSNEYFCSAGIFVLSPTFFDILQDFSVKCSVEDLRWLAPALMELMRRESVYGQEIEGRRINLEERFGLLRAQVAMGLASSHRDAVSTVMLEEALRGRR